MEIKGKIVRVMEVVTGNGSKGIWSKQEFVIEQPGQFPKNVCLQLWGENLITKYDLVVGLTVTAHINIESREHGGRFYTDVRCWKLEWDSNQTRKWQPDERGAEAKDYSINKMANKSEHHENDNIGRGSTTDDLPF